MLLSGPWPPYNFVCGAAAGASAPGLAADAVGWKSRRVRNKVDRVSTTLAERGPEGPGQSRARPRRRLVRKALPDAARHDSVLDPAGRRGFARDDRKSLLSGKKPAPGAGNHRPSTGEVFPAVILEHVDIISQIRTTLDSGAPLHAQRITYRAPGIPVRFYYYNVLPVNDRRRVKPGYVMLVMEDVTEQVRLKWPYPEYRAATGQCGRACHRYHSVHRQRDPYHDLEPGGRNAVGLLLRASRSTFAERIPGR